jgi:hypothetical protein
MGCKIKIMNIDELQDMTDWFQYKEITRKSKAKQTDFS